MVFESWLWSAVAVNGGEPAVRDYSGLYWLFLYPLSVALEGRKKLGRAQKSAPEQQAGLALKAQLLRRHHATGSQRRVNCGNNI